MTVKDFHAEADELAAEIEVQIREGRAFLDGLPELGHQSQFDYDGVFESSIDV